MTRVAEHSTPELSGDGERMVANRLNWDDRAQQHAASPAYEIDRLLSDAAAISKVVAFDLPLLAGPGVPAGPDVLAGLDIVHLQCHIGTDTLSLHRLGGRVTGLDFSGASLGQARELARRAGAAIEYVDGNVYDAPDLLGRERFDLVYTGIGALCWLPDIAAWARVVAALLRPGGRLFVRDAHPVMNALADAETAQDPVRLEYPYTEAAGPTRWDDGLSYIVGATMEHGTTYEWNHGLGEIVTGCLDAGLTMTGLAEHDSLPWPQLGPLMTRDDATGEWRPTDRPERLAASFTLQARRAPH